MRNNHCLSPLGSKHKTTFLLGIGLINLLILYKLLIMNQQPRKDNSGFLTRYPPLVGHRNNATCPDFLTGGAKGRWLTRPLTTDEQNSIDAYLKEERGAYYIPPTYQRPDGRCGDVPYEQSPLYRHMWFKAICNPIGATPCCHTNSCLPLSEDECRCPTCYDERQAIHAEFSTWRPDDARCLVETFGALEACSLLNGSTLYFVGDSFIRHVFAATVILLTNNTADGALRPDVEPSLKARCKGMHQITGLTCRELLDENRTLCHGTVHVRYVQVFPSRELPLTEPLLNSLRHINKSIVIMGLGIHDDFNFNVVNNKFLLPFLNMRQFLSTSHDKILDLNMVLTNFGNQNSDTRAGNPTQTNVSKHFEYLIPRDIVGKFRDEAFNSLWKMAENFGRQANFKNNPEILFRRFGDVLGPSLEKSIDSERLLSHLLRIDGRNTTFLTNGSQILANVPLEVKPEDGPPIKPEDGPSFYSHNSGKALNFKDSTFTALKQTKTDDTVKDINNIGTGGLNAGPHSRYITDVHTGPHVRDMSPLLSPQTEVIKTSGVHSAERGGNTRELQLNLGQGDTNKSQVYPQGILSRQPARPLLRDAGVLSGNQLRDNPDILPSSSGASNTAGENTVFEQSPRDGVDVEKLWPRLLWIGAHAPGLLKSPKFKRQTAEGVQEFNTQVQRVLRQWHVPYLDTFGLTNGTVSFDGTHYGWGINMMKVNMILTYMKAELVQGWD